MDYGKLEELLTVSQVAEMHDVPARIVRKAARRGTIPGQIKVLGKYGFDPELSQTWTPPEPGEFGTRKAKREDGRQRYRIYLTVEEATTLQGQGFEVTDPRDEAKVRRAARKAAAVKGETQAQAQAQTQEGDDPFADFGA